MSRSGRRLMADSLKGLARVRSRYYQMLADNFITQIGLRPLRVILEAGCGNGQLTIPLVERLPKRVKVIAVDSSTDPYAGWLDELALKLRRARLDRRVHLIRADVRKIKEVEDESLDAIVSNELLCDLPRKAQLEKSLKEFYRILRPGGVMIHGEWSSCPANGGEAFEVKHSPAWNPDQLFALTKQAGFHDFHVTYFETTIHFGYETVIEELRSWGVTESFLKQNERLLKRHGIQLPYEHVIQCEK